VKGGGDVAQSLLFPVMQLCHWSAS